MEIIREYAIYAKRCIVRTKTYHSELAHFENLFEEAKKDFPDLRTGEVIVVKYGGMRYKNTFGIEFCRLEKIVPETYLRIKKLENTF